MQVQCSAQDKRGGKSQRSHRFPSAASTPPQLGRWRSASGRPPVCLLACFICLRRTSPPSSQPASQRQVKRSCRTQPRPPRPTREGGVFALQRPRLASRCELLRHLLFSAPPFLQAGLSSLLAARSESVSGSLGGALPPPAGTKKKGSSLDSC